MTLPVSIQPTTRQVLRDYQQQAIEALRQHIRAGCKRLLLVAPTGSGKTTIAAAMIEAAVAKGKRIIFLAHRKELIDQCSKRLGDLGVEHGIIMADHPARRQWLRVHVASVQTLINRKVDAPDLVFVDECHRARAKSYEHILDQWPDACVVGLTATPVRSDGKGLGNLFQQMVECPGVADLTSMGYLVPTRVFAPSKPDLQGVKITAGDYNQGQLGLAMDKPTITGDIVAHWAKLGEGRITIVFCVGVDHSKHVRDQFLQAGVPAAHLDGETPIREREGLLADLAAGRIRVLCSVGVLTEGFDCPAVSCIVLARPTKSLSLALQMQGRGLRLYPGKADCLILDHAGCSLAHGLVDDPREWSLEPDRKRQQGPDIDLNANVPRVCPKCYRVYPRTARRCDPCGYTFFRTKRDGPQQVDGELQQVASGRDRYAWMGTDRRKDLYMSWVEEQRLKGYKQGYAYMKYRSMFKHEPPTAWQLEASLAARSIS